MNLLDKMERAMENKDKIFSDDVPEQKKSKRTYARRVQSRPIKLIVPDHIKVLFDNLDKSISSVWGLRPDGSNKWDAKFNQWETFKMWFKEMM